jgi:hypothetical protein
MYYAATLQVIGIHHSLACKWYITRGAVQALARRAKKAVGINLYVPAEKTPTMLTAK